MMAQGMDTGMNPELLMKMMQRQQMQQGLSSTGQMNARDLPLPVNNGAPVATPGTVSNWVPPPARFDQSAQPGLAGIAPRNVPPPVDAAMPKPPPSMPGPMVNNEMTRGTQLPQMGPSSPLREAYKVPPSLAR